MGRTSTAANANTTSTIETETRARFRAAVLEAVNGKLDILRKMLHQNNVRGSTPL